MIQNLIYVTGLMGVLAAPPGVDQKGLVKGEEKISFRPMIKVSGVAVDYQCPIETLLLQGGYKLGHRVEVTSKILPPLRKGSAVIEMAIFQFKGGGKFPTKDMLAEMQKHGYRPAFPREILSLGIQRPDVLKLPLVAIQSEADAFYVVPREKTVYRNQGISSGWYGYYRFAGVREKTPEA